MNYLCKMCGYPHFSFWISITLVKIYLSCIIINPGKNTFELVGTVLIRTVPTNSKVFLRGLLNMWKKQILTSGTEISKKKTGGNYAFFEDNLINNIYKKL